MARRPGSCGSTAVLVALTLGIPAASVANAAVNPARCADRFGTPGMVSYWTFDDPLNPGRDDVGGNHGVVVEGAMQVASGQKVGAGAMRFSGGTDHLRLDYAAFRKASSDRFTVSTWFYADSFSGSAGMNIFGVGGPCGPDTGKFGWTTVVDPIGSVLFSTGKWCQANNSIPSAPVPAGSWTHAVGVYDAGIILVYVDGLLRASDSFTLGSTPAPSALIAAIGNNLGDPATRGFRGLIDEVAFFDRALSPAEIQGLYDDSSAGRNYCEPACSDGDHDGFGSPGSSACPAGDRVDCNDADATTFPGATELCDGIDNNCDGLTPGNELDADQDGSRICNGDCDDSNALAYPGAPEVFDGVDNDCDGLRDEGLDDDGDGVPNSLDACPGTVAGTVVGADGCAVCDKAHGRCRDHDSRSKSDDRSGKRDDRSGKRKGKN